MTDQKYTLTMINNSTNAWDLCLFQQDPQMDTANFVSLAWFAKHCHPGTFVKFTWSMDYCFVWSEQDTLIPGINAGQIVPTNLEDMNQIRLLYDDGFYFGEQQNDTRGTLHIITDQSVPLKKGTVGIGMSGSGTFAVTAQPNLHLNFTPHPTYWATFGYYKPGDVIDVTETSKFVEVKYPPGIVDQTLLLNSDNQWSLT